MVVRVPEINFGPLAQLGKLYQDAKMQSGRQTLLSELGQRAGYADMARGFYGIGDLETGVAFQKMADAQVERAADNARASAALVPSSVREFQFAKQQGYEGSFADWQREGSSTGGYGVTPVYGIDEQGNEVIMQVGKSGEAVATKLPAGVRPLGIGGREREKARGKGQGEAIADAPKAIQQGETILAQIDGVINDPNRTWGTGASSVFNWVPASPGYDFQQKSDQLGGQAFLQAFQELKGGGAITEIEGQKATQAIARLSTAQSEAAYMAALNELRGVVTAGLYRARLRAGQSAAKNGAQPVQAQPSNSVTRFQRGPDGSIVRAP